MSDLRISQVLALEYAELKKTWEISKSPVKADQVDKSTPHARTAEKRAQSEKVEKIRRDLFNDPSTSQPADRQPASRQPASHKPASYRPVSYRLVSYQLVSYH